MPAALPEGVVCPNCGGPTEPGAVYNGRGVYWLDEGQRPGILLPAPEALLPRTWVGLRSKTLPARRCTDCRVAVLRY